MASARSCRAGPLRRPPDDSRGFGRASSAGWSAPAPPGSTMRGSRHSLPTAVRPPASSRVGMSDVRRDSHAGLGKRYGSTVGAARLHARDPGRVGDGARRAERRRQDDAAALVIGLVEPTSGVVEVFGRSPRRDATAVLPRLGFVAQEHPLYRGLTIAETLKSGASSTRAGTSGSPPRGSSSSGCRRQKVGQLSGGQQAQVALTLALAKRHELLAARRAGRLARPARAPRVPEGGDGGRRRRPG